MAFRSGVDDWGADMLELDVHATADGRVVVIHDDSVDRTCDGTGKVRELTWPEIEGMDAGYHFTDPAGDASFRGGDARVPLLDEVLEAFPGMRLNIEAKVTEVAPLLVETVRRHRAEARVLMASAGEAARGSRHGYAGPVGASERQARLFYVLHRTPLGFLYTPAADALQVPDTWEGRQVLTPRFVREAHRRNIPVHVWTIDEPGDMRRLLAWGVDGIQTDRPDRLARVLCDDTGRPPPPALRARSDEEAAT